MINSFRKTGFHNFGSILDTKKCLEIQNRISKLRKLDRKIFYSSEKEFLKKGRFLRYSPGTNEHNLLVEDKNFNLDFIEQSSRFKKSVSKILGKNFRIMKKSVIRSVPYHILPNWVKKRVTDVGRPNLNPYIKDHFQDVQFYLNADFHQDMTRGKKFCTFYVYLDTVKEKDSYLQVLEGSHVLGAQPYPHYLRKSIKDKKLWYYNDFKDMIPVKQRNVMGKGGTLSCWHGLALHGTYYNFSKSPRISIRYLIEPDKKSKNSPFLKSFKDIKNPLVIKSAGMSRLDRNPNASFRKTGMSITG